MLRRLSVLALASLAMSAALAASTASVSSSTGKVMVSHEGGDFVPLRPGQELDAGDRLMVAKGGSAIVKFGDGCTMSVAENSIVVMPEISTCAGANVATETIPEQGAGSASTSPDFDWATFAWIAIPTVAWVLAENEGQTVSP